MKKKMREQYNKAVKYYDQGNIDKAINICEEAMAESLKNTNILNLKGIMLYQKGQLDDAITVWNINREFNDDEMSKMYIRDSIKDREKEKIYKDGQRELKALKIDRALDLFKKCAESGFNAIKVNTSIALCYMKKGEYDIAREYVDKVLSIDREYKIANDILKNINEVCGDRKDKKDNKKIYIKIFISAIILGAILGVGKVVLNNINLKGDKTALESIEEKSEIQKKDEKKTEQPKEETNNKDSKILNVDKLNIAIDNDEVYSIYDTLNGVDYNSLSASDKKLYNKGKDIIIKTGIEKFYKKGQEEYNNSNYNSAKSEFDKALEYSKGNYLREHILYYEGMTESKLKNNKEAIKYFEEYYKEFKKGSYSDEVLYNLALLNEKDDLEQSKMYARILKDKYSNSMYNNQNIENILKK